MCGWIKLQRDIMSHWIAQDNEYLAVWIRMLSEANFESQTKMFNGQVITVGRGQFIFGLDSYAEKTKVSVMRLRRLVDLLEKHQMINRVKRAKYSLISIVNYDKYQADNRQTTGTEQAENNTIRSKEYKEVNNTVDSDESTIDFISIQFDRFWRNYPTKKAKVPAEKAFAKLVKGKKESQVRFYVDMILNYHLDCIDRGEIGADKLHASTLINQQRWKDNLEFFETFKREWIAENE
jgi:hypothetical protein